MNASTLISNTFFIMFKVVPYFLPFVLGYVAWKSWVEFVNTRYMKRNKWITLQVILPKEVAKSPQAMEVVLSNAFYQTGSTPNWWKKYVLGNVRAHFSLELVSIEGNVYFFIRTGAFFKNLIESQIYAQYPNIEILEVEDYVHQVPHNPLDNGWKMWGCEYKLSKDDVYPIKTYVDYGLDKPPMPAFPGFAPPPSNQVDPMTALIEFLGHIGKGEQIWMQFVIRAAWDKYHKHGTLFGTQGWAADAAARVKKIKDDMKGKPDAEGKTPNKILSKGEQDVVAALERKISKLGFDVGIRSLYMADSRIFNGINNVGLVGALKQYNTNDLNAFGLTFATDYDFPWQDFWGRNERRNCLNILEAYRERQFHYVPWSETLGIHHLHHKTFVLNVEELATVYHFPGRVSETPTFKRVDSKKGEPPQNLPI